MTVLEREKRRRREINKRENKPKEDKNEGEGDREIGGRGRRKIRKGEVVEERMYKAWEDKGCLRKKDRE